MKLIEFPEQTIVIAKNQPEYLPMPAHVAEDGTVTCCWSLTLRERVTLLFTGQIWQQILTFNNPLQPQRLDVVKPSTLTAAHTVN